MALPPRIILWSNACLADDNDDDDNIMTEEKDNPQRNRRNHKQEENQNKTNKTPVLDSGRKLPHRTPNQTMRRQTSNLSGPRHKKSNRTTHTQERRKQTEWNTKHDGSITNDESRGWKEFDAGEKSHSPTSPTSKRRRGTETAT